MIDWDKLDVSFSKDAQALLMACAQKGVKMIPYMGLRTLDQQNRLYRQSRSSQAVLDKASELKREGAPYLSQRLLDVGIQSHKPRVTNAVGGLSWHNWGLAMDCYWMDGDDKINWDGTAEGYQIYGEMAGKMGLKWGGDFSSLKDCGHVQAPPDEPLDIMSYADIDGHFQSQEKK